MQVQNMLESNGEGKGYVSGNIRLVKIKAGVVEVHKHNKEIIIFEKVEDDIHRTFNSRTEASGLLR